MPSLKPQKFYVTYADDLERVEEVLVFHSDIVATETRFDTSIGGEDVAPRTEWTMFMVWSALRRNKKAPDFQEWLDRGVLIEPEDEDEVTGDPESSGESADA
jgi:hypothetical protein